MLRRNTPYGNIIYMLRLLENDRKTSFLTDLFSRSRYMKRVQLFNGRYTKGVPFVKNSIYKGKGLDLGAKPLRAKLYWVASRPPPLLPRAFHKLLGNFWQLLVFRATFFVSINFLYDFWAISLTRFFSNSEISEQLLVLKLALLPYCTVF